MNVGQLTLVIDMNVGRLTLVIDNRRIFKSFLARK